LLFRDRILHNSFRSMEDRARSTWTQLWLPSPILQPPGNKHNLWWYSRCGAHTWYILYLHLAAWSYINLCLLCFRMPWQGDKAVIIDRFDGRAHLDFLPEFKGSANDLPDPDAVNPTTREISEINYERYRILIQNEFLRGGKLSNIV